MKLFFIILHLPVLLFLLMCSNTKKTKVIPDHPQWVKDAVFYQIFPERFRNGDLSNDPKLEDIRGSYPHDMESGWQLSPWTSDWYALQPWEMANGKGFAHNAQRRRYGGDIQGIMDKLDYLYELGINAIYLNPMFESPSLHKYDAANYVHIDDNFGPDPEYDKRVVRREKFDDPSTWQWTRADSLFLEFIKAAHQRKIKVIIDGVFNHVGIRHPAFLDVRENGVESAYKDWFVIEFFDDPATPENEFSYKGWAGVRELPELKENEQGLVAPVKKHIFDITARWMDPDGDSDPSDGIDGWRLDVAETVHHNFWKDFRKHVKSINPEAYLTGEIFWDDWHNEKLMDPQPWLQGDQFDGVMNYRWSLAVTNFFIDKENKISASSFFTRLKKLNESYAPETRFVLQNLLDSHDTDRILSNIINPDNYYDKGVTLHDNPYYDVRKPNQKELEILKLIAIYQMTAPGAPMIYYGTETGMWGADDPDCRKPMIWPDMEYEDEVANISKTPRPRDEVEFNRSLYEFYRKLISLRHQEIALRRGTFEPVFAFDEKDVLAYKRQYQNETIMVVINNSERIQQVAVPVNHASAWQSLLSDLEFQAEQNLPLKIKPKSAFILKKIQ